MRNYESGFYSDYQVGEIFLKRYILLHLDDNYEKVKLLCLMSKKLKWLNDE